MIKAAGILFISPENEILLLKRSASGDHVGEWCLPGGKIESGETPDQAARRELQEECQHNFDGELFPIFHTEDANVAYTTFCANSEIFTPTLDHEHTGFIWCAIDDVPENLHPGVKALFASDAVSSKFTGEEVKADSSEIITEMDIAKKIRDGELTSPQQYKNISIFALRITGTGVSYRSKLDEYVNRLPENYLSQEFLERCNGLPVIWKHPDSQRLDSESFAERIVGTICLPYIEGNEVWGIAKIWDESAAQNMQEVQLSTSPGVVFDAGTNVQIQLKDGKHILIEGKPSLIDHVAVCENGVWDKGGEPSGVLLETANVEMTEASRADSADSQGSSIKGESTMADEVTTSPAQSAESEMLSLLKVIAEKQTGIEKRLEALEAAEEAELANAVKADEMNPNAPATMLNVDGKADAVESPAATVEAPAYVADKARMDALEAEIKKLSANAARQDNAEEAKEFAEAQKRADDADQCYGDSAPRPLMGETVLAYRQRLLARHLPRSARWAGKSVSAISDAATLSVIEDQVYADSMEAARKCVGMPSGQLRAVKVQTGTGHDVTEFIGKDSFVKNFAAPAINGKFNRKAA